MQDAPFASELRAKDVNIWTVSSGVRAENGRQSGFLHVTDPFFFPLPHHNEIDAESV